MLHSATGGSRKPIPTPRADAHDEDRDQQPRKPRVRLLREREQGADLREESGPLLGRGTACCHGTSLPFRAASSRLLPSARTPRAHLHRSPVTRAPALGAPIRLDDVTKAAEVRLQSGVPRDPTDRGRRGLAVAGSAGVRADGGDGARRRRRRSSVTAGWGGMRRPVGPRPRAGRHPPAPGRARRAAAGVHRAAGGLPGATCAAAADLTAGEGVTVAVSLLRGSASCQRRRAVRGVVVADRSRSPRLRDRHRRAHSLDDQTADLLRRIAARRARPGRASWPMRSTRCPTRGAVHASSSARRRRSSPSPSRSHWRRRHSGRSARGDRALADVDGIGRPGPEPVLRGRSSLSRHLDADWADLVSRTTTGVWRAVRTPRPGRGRPWLVAGGLAGAIVVGGLLWPTGDGGTGDGRCAPPSRSEPSPSAGADSGSGPSSGPTADPSAPAQDERIRARQTGRRRRTLDLASITAALLTARTDCGGDAGCLEAVARDRRRAVSAGCRRSCRRRSDR